MNTNNCLLNDNGISNLIKSSLRRNLKFNTFNAIVNTIYIYNRF